MSQHRSSKPLVVIVTGLSGAGNSTALAALADNGLYCIDNLPVEMLESTINFMLTGRISSEHGFAFGMDVRDKSFAACFPKLIRTFNDRVRTEVIFLTADESVIATRYSTTRRRHPLLGSGETLSEAIDRERQLLSPVEETADTVFDTSSWSPHMLARAMEQRLSADIPPRILHLSITSFGFKYGHQKPVDTMFDVRFLDNPHFVPGLRQKTGLDAEVADYVFAQENAQNMFRKMEDMLRFSLPFYYQEGKHYLRVGVGCSGGRHRSVAMAEELGKAFLRRPIPNVITTILHRDIDQ